LERHHARAAGVDRPRDEPDRLAALARVDGILDAPTTQLARQPKGHVNLALLIGRPLRSRDHAALAFFSRATRPAAVIL
jgi:hypothetical protein